MLVSPAAISCVTTLCTEALNEELLEATRKKRARG
jgi:hypothetical protein